MSWFSEWSPPHPPSASLSGGSGQIWVKENPYHFLDYDHDILYVRPFCKEVAITQSALLKDDLPLSVSVKWTVSEPANFAAKQGLKIDLSSKWVSQLSEGAFSCMGSTLTTAT